MRNLPCNETYKLHLNNTVKLKQTQNNAVIKLLSAAKG